MDYEEHFKEQEIWFDLNAAESELLDNAAFIHLILMKFDGEIIDSSRYEDNADAIYTFKVKFPSWDECSSAKAHCDRNMSTKGNVVADYKGALNAADPARNMAENILKKVNHNITLLSTHMTRRSFGCKLRCASFAPHSLLVRQINRDDRILQKTYLCLI